MAAVLSKTRSILTLVDYVDDLNSGEWFRYADEESAAFERRVYVDRQTFEDMGEPDTITVTIEPGDTLN